MGRTTVASNFILRFALVSMALVVRIGMRFDPDGAFLIGIA